MSSASVKVVAISGASSGIGLATAKLFANRGWRVYNLSRRGTEEKRIIDIATNVGDKATVKEAFARIKNQSGRLDLLITSAGYGISGAVEFTPLDQAKQQFDINFFGTLTCIQGSLPLLRESKGRIICISSAAAVFAIPFQAFYSASKAAVNILADGLANELRQFGISVCALQLGDVKTDFSKARVKTHSGDDLYRGAIGRSVAIMEQDENKGMTPEVIARAIYKIARHRKVRPLYTLGAKYKLFVLLNKLLPHSFVNHLIGKIYSGQ